MHKKTAAHSALLLILSLLACATCIVYYRSTATQAHRFTIVCTTTIIADAVHRIVGDQAHVIPLMGPTIDPHTYRPKESDLKKILSANLILYHGLHLEGKMADMLSALSWAPTVSLGDILDTQELLLSPDSQSIYDPHIWFDVSLWRTVVTHLGEILMKYDAAHADFYREQCSIYCAELDTLDRWIHETIATIPMEKRVLVTAHDAFGYFGRRYSLQVIGLQGISTESEPGITDIHRVAHLIASNRIPALFVESSVSARSLRAVQEATAAYGWHVKLGEALYTDALGPIGSSAQTYCQMVQHNVQAIVNGLH